MLILSTRALLNDFDLTRPIETDETFKVIYENYPLTLIGQSNANSVAIAWRKNIANHDLVGDEIVTGNIVVALARYDAVATVDVAHPVQHIEERFHFNHASIQVGMIAATYRIKDLTQLRLLKGGLQIPDYMRIPAADRFMVEKSYYS